MKYNNTIIISLAFKHLSGSVYCLLSNQIHLNIRRNSYFFATNQYLVRVYEIHFHSNQSNRWNRNLLHFFQPPRHTSLSTSDYIHTICRKIAFLAISKPDNPNQFHFIVLQRHPPRDRVKPEDVYVSLSLRQKGIFR